jgi:hypothetical protein
LIAMVNDVSVAVALIAKVDRDAFKI